MANVIHHDPQKFSMALRALLIAHSHLDFKSKQASSRPKVKRDKGMVYTNSPLLTSSHSEVNAVLSGMIKNNFS